MIQVILGEKIDQTQKFLTDGTRIPVTEIAVPDNAVLQIKTPEKDKYRAVQIGIGKKKKPSKGALGHVKKAGLDSVPIIITEVKFSIGEAGTDLKPGDFVKINDILKPGDIVDVTAISKGKGFAGVVKRHGFRGGPKTHGQSDRTRAPGSIGQTTTPGRVYRGKRMAGHTGHETVTIKNLKIIAVDELNKKLLISGLVPGVRRSIVRITRVGEDKKFVPLFKVEEPKQDIAEQVVPQTTSEEKTVEAQPAKADVEVKTETKIEEIKPETKEPKENEDKSNVNKKGEGKVQK